MQAAARLCDVLREGGVRCAVDSDPHQSPGWCVLLLALAPATALGMPTKVAERRGGPFQH